MFKNDLEGFGFTMKVKPGDGNATVSIFTDNDVMTEFEISLNDENFVEKILEEFVKFYTVDFEFNLNNYSLDTKIGIIKKYDSEACLAYAIRLEDGYSFITINGKYSAEGRIKEDVVDLYLTKILDNFSDAEFKDFVDYVRDL